MVLDRPCHRFRPTCRSQLGQDVAHMEVHRRSGYDKPAGDGRVAEALHQMLISEAREGNNLDAWMSLANRARCGNAVHLRQHQIHQRHIWLNSRTQLHRFFACLSLTRQLEIVGCVQEGHQPTAHHFMVVYDQYTNATYAVGHCRTSISARGARQFSVTRVPASGWLLTSSSAPMVAARSRMMPTPRSPAGMTAGSNPRPSSATRNSRLSLLDRSRSSAWPARACLAVLFSAS